MITDATSDAGSSRAYARASMSARLLEGDGSNIPSTAQMDDRRIVSGPPAGDKHAAETHKSILSDHHSLAAAKEALRSGIDKAEFLRLASVKLDERIQPPCADALERADSDTIYVDGSVEPSERNVELDFDVHMAALRKGRVQVRLFDSGQMDRILGHHVPRPARARACNISVDKAALETTCAGTLSPSFSNLLTGHVC